MPISTLINGVQTTVDLRQGDRVIVPLANESITVHIQNTDGPQFLPVALVAKATEVVWAPEDDPNG